MVGAFAFAESTARLRIDSGQPVCDGRRSTKRASSTLVHCRKRDSIAGVFQQRSIALKRDQGLSPVVRGTCPRTAHAHVT